MKYYIDKISEQVKMVSEEDIDVDTSKFNVVEINDTDFEGYKIHYKKNKLTKEKIKLS